MQFNWATLATKKDITVSVYPLRVVYTDYNDYFDGWVQDCSNSIANALELLQS